MNATRIFTTVGGIVWAVVRGILIGSTAAFAVGVGCSYLYRVFSSDLECMAVVAAGANLLVALLVAIAVVAVYVEARKAPPPPELSCLRPLPEDAVAVKLSVFITAKEELRTLRAADKKEQLGAVATGLVLPALLAALALGVHGVHRIHDLFAAEDRTRAILEDAREAKGDDLLRRLAVEVKLAEVSAGYRQPAVLGRFDPYAPFLGAALVATAFAFPLAGSLTSAMPDGTRGVVNAAVIGVVGVVLPLVIAAVVHAHRFQDSIATMSGLPATLR